MGRPASGVIGVDLDSGDRVVDMGLVSEGAALLVITSKGFGKRTPLPEYPAKGRGTGGVITIKLRPGDSVVAARVVRNTSLLTFITSSGIVMRTPTDGISLMGRLTQGVTIVNPNGSDRVASLACEEPEDEAGSNGTVLMNLE
jgi:DNA gyrase subunit A